MAKRIVIGLVVLGLVIGLVKYRLDRDPVVGTFSLGDGAYALALDQQRGRAFLVSTGENRLRILDTHTLTLLRSVAAGPYPVAVTVDERLGQAFIADSGDSQSLIVRSPNMSNKPILPGMLRVFDNQSGTQVHTVALGFHPYWEVVDRSTGRIFVADITGLMMSILDDRSAAIPTTALLGTLPNAVALDVRSGHVFVAGACCDAGPRRSLAMLDIASGRILRTYLAGTSVALAVDEPRRRVYLADFNGMSVLDADSGRFLFNFRAGLMVEAVTVDARTGHLFVAGLNAAYQMVAEVVERQGGRVLHRAVVSLYPQSVGPRAVLAVDAGRGRVFVGTKGRLSMLDARTGALVHTMDVPVSPSVMRVDTRTGYLFVAGLREAAPDTWGWIPTWLRGLPFVPPRQSAPLRPPVSGQQIPPSTQDIPGQLLVLDPDRL